MILRMTLPAKQLAGFVLSAVFAASFVTCSAAENLRLRDGISFMHDLDKGFPIIADRMEDLKVDADKATLIFFGAAGDLNTNRQARRVVELYKKYRNSSTKFIVVDVDHAESAEAKQLIKSQYQGYIPAVVIIDQKGKTTWNHAGETDLSTISHQMDKVLEEKSKADN